MLCSNCGKNEAAKKSRKGYCLICAQAARDAWHARMRQSTIERQERKDKMLKIIREADEAARDAALNAEDKFGICSVLIRPGGHSIVYNLKENGAAFGETRGGQGARLLSPPGIYPQKQWAWAIKFAEVLRNHGIRAEADLPEHIEYGI